jgi:CubicO group peptidase (beta-lactamase class C family)
MVTSSDSDPSLNPVRRVLEKAVERGAASGAVALIGRGDNVHVLAIGTKTLGAADPMRRDSIFRISSLTKPVTAAATMMLIEDGKFRLDEPVDDLLPELSRRQVLRNLASPLSDTVPAKRSITAEDLLTMRCGMGVVLAPPDTYPVQRAISEQKLVGFGPPDPASELTPDAWIHGLSALPLMSQPGESWMYNTGSYVLGVLIARASGTSLSDFLKERIFDPADMRDTGFVVPKAKMDRFVDAYRPAAEGLELYDAAAGGAWSAVPAFPDGGAGLVSTAEDYFAFSRLILRGGTVGNRRLLSQASIEAMTHNHLTPAERSRALPILAPNHGWGYGMSVVIEGTPEGVPSGSFGWNGGLGTSWVAVPRSDMSVILMTQTAFRSPDPPAIHKDFWRSVFHPPSGQDP